MSNTNELETRKEKTVLRCIIENSSLAEQVYNAQLINSSVEAASDRHILLVFQFVILLLRCSLI